MERAALGQTRSRWVRELAEKSDIMQFAGGRLNVDFIETPYNQFGILDKQELMSQIIGSITVSHYWLGDYVGPHHLMWPRNAYQNMSPRSARDVATKFRGSPSLKLILPRQLHDYLHVVTEPPRVPDTDVMEQYNVEQFNVQRLYDTIRFHGGQHLGKKTLEQRNHIMWQTLLDKLDLMDDPYLGVMPDKEHIACSDIVTARPVLRAIARTQGLSNDARCNQAFFNPPTFDIAEELAA